MWAHFLRRVDHLRHEPRQPDCIQRGRRRNLQKSGPSEGRKMTETGRVALKIWALVLAVALGSLTVPGCVIQIGPGTTSAEPSDPTGATTGAGAGPSTTPEEQAAIEALE